MSKNKDINLDNILDVLNDDEKNNQKPTSKNGEDKGKDDLVGKQQNDNQIQNKYQQDYQLTPEEKEREFRIKLFNSKKDNAHIMFFQNNNQLESVEIPILARDNPLEKLIPFRNFKCKRPDCVYSYQDLLNIYKKQGMSLFTFFICKSCKKYLEIWNFYLDTTLQILVDDIWKKFNNSEKVPCEKVIIFKNGSWEPVLPKYIKQLDKNIRQDLDISNKTIKVESVNQLDSLVDKDQDDLELMQNMALFVDFKDQEYIEYLHKYQQDSQNTKNKNEPITDIFDKTLNYKMIDNILQDVSISQELLIVYLNYTIAVYQIEYQVISQGLIIKNIQIDNFSKKSSYELIWEKFNPKKSEIKVNIILIHFDQRWILGMFSPGLMKCRIVDFLVTDLSYTNNDELINVFSSIISNEYKYKLQPHNFVVQNQCKKIPQYLDCGIQQISYIEKYMSDINRNQLWEIDINYLEKERFKKQFLWLLFKIINQNLTVTSEQKNKRNFNNPNKTFSQDNSLLNKIQRKNEIQKQQTENYGQVFNLDLNQQLDQSRLTINTIKTHKSNFNQQNNLKNDQSFQNILQNNEYKTKNDQSVNYDQLFDKIQKKNIGNNQDYSFSTQNENLSVNNTIVIQDGTKNSFSDKNNIQKSKSNLKSINQIKSLQNLNQSQSSQSQVELNQEQLIDTLEKYKQNFKQEALQKLKLQNPNLYQANINVEDAKQLNNLKQNKQIKDEIKKLLDKQDEQGLLNDLNQLDPQTANQILYNYSIQKQLKANNIQNYNIAPPIDMQYNPYNIQIENSSQNQNNIYHQQLQQIGYNKYFGNQQIYNRPNFNQSQLYKSPQTRINPFEQNYDEQYKKQVARMNYDISKNWKF